MKLAPIIRNQPQIIENRFDVFEINLKTSDSFFMKKFFGNIFEFFDKKKFF